MRQFVDGILHPANVLQLAARVAVNQLQAVEHVALLQQGVQLENLADEQAEFGLLAGGFAPSSGAFAGKLDAHAYLGPYAVLFSVF